LAGKPAADDIASGEVVAGHLAHVLEALRLGPVMRQHLARKCVLLDLPPGHPEPGPLKAELKAPNP